MKQAVLSLSGGMDSSTLLLHLLANGYKVTALSFDYGQKHRVELERAQQLVDYINDIPYNRFTQVINSNSLSSFYETKLDFILESIIDNNNSSTEKVRIGVFGVVTDVKLKLLTFELKVVHNYKKVYVCKDLSAGFNQKGHKDGIKYMKYVLGAKVYGEDKFRKKFNIKRQVLTI